MSRADAVAASRARDAAPLFAALGDETRLRLLSRLSSSGPETTAMLGASSQVSRQAITKHLGVLADAGLVRSTRLGRDRVWELEPARLADAHQHLDRISQQWDEALDRLKKLVEG